MFSTIRMPLLFVFLWSSAYIAFEFCSTKIEPATFVIVRTTTSAAILLLVLLVLKSPWPNNRKDIIGSVVVGVLLHGVYGGGSFASVYHGIDIRLCALILSLQPALTVLLSGTFLGEKITSLKILGILSGLFGVSIMILDTSSMSNSTRIFNGENSFLAVSLSFVAVFAISVATIVQKRCCSNTHLLSGTIIQFLSAAAVMIPVALTLETMKIKMDLGFFLGMGWLILFVAIGAILILMSLIKRECAGSVANLFYLVTPLVAIYSWILFDQELSYVSLAGMAICTFGVILVGYVSVERQPRVAT